MTFLPVDYETPKASNESYFKLNKGENKVRILSSAVVGWEDWTTDAPPKPVRFRMNQKPDRPMDPNRRIKHFWACVIWDYSSQKISIWQITQASIQSAIAALVKDEDWGDPKGYDLKITRKGDGMETEYFVSPIPHKPAAPEILEQYQSNPINLEGLFDGEDPFKDRSANNQQTITKEQAEELKTLAAQVGISMHVVLQKHGYQRLGEIPTSKMEQIKSEIHSFAEEF